MIVWLVGDRLKKIAVTEVKKATGRPPKLKQVCSTRQDACIAASDARLTRWQVKIVRSDDRVDASGRLRSRGFAFVEFVDHSDALHALRAINNNPMLFGAQRRPIVEFALENALALQKRQQAQVKRENALRAKQKQATEAAAPTAKETKRLQKKEARRERRKENRKKGKGEASTEESATASATETANTTAPAKSKKAAKKPAADNKDKKKKNAQPQQQQPPLAKKQPAPAIAKKAEKRKRVESTDASEDFEARHLNKRSVCSSSEAGLNRYSDIE